MSVGWGQVLEESPRKKHMVNGHGGSPAGGGHHGRYRSRHGDGQGSRVTALRGATLTFVSKQGTIVSL